MHSQDAIGETLGRYRLLRELGRGGMAVVYLAEDPSLGRRVAVKVMHLHLWDRAEHAARFVREARAVAAIRHPNIVEIYDFAQVQESESGRIPAYIVSELVEGPTLRQFLDSHARLMPEVAAMVGMKLAAALGCAHERGIIHRDLKPENVMITTDGRVLLGDFGIARVAEGESVTQTGAMIGSPAYMSPEQARGGEIDPRSDLFSLGTVLYLLCTGSLPFPGKDPLSTVLKVISGRFEPPLKLNPALGTPMDRLIRRLLTVDPDGRPATARAVEADLRELTARAGISDVDAELSACFASPAQYHASLAARVIESSLTLGQQALERGDVPAALSFCDRVLALDPRQPAALALMDRLTARASLPRKALLAMGVLLLVAGAAAGAFLWQGPQPSPGPGARGAAGVGPADGGAGEALPSQARDLAAAEPQAGDGAASGAVSRGTDGPRKRPVHGRQRGQTPLAGRDAGASGGATRPVDRGLPRPDRGGPRSSPDASSRPPGPASLKVLIGPWCDLEVDGSPAGRSPLVQPLDLEPGRHRVRCRFGDGSFFEEQVTLKPGEQRELRGVQRVAVKLQLTRGRAVRVNGKVLRADGSMAPKRYRIDLLDSEGKVLEGAWVTIPVSGCTLRDVPRLACTPAP